MLVDTFYNLTDTWSKILKTNHLKRPKPTNFNQLITHCIYFCAKDRRNNVRPDVPRRKLLELGMGGHLLCWCFQTVTNVTFSRHNSHHKLRFSFYFNLQIDNANNKK